MDNKDCLSQQGEYRYLNNMKELLNTTSLIIAVIDPLGSIQVYSKATKHFDKKHKEKLQFTLQLLLF